MNKLLILLVLFSATIINSFAEDFPRSRPNEAGEPTKVLVGFYITDFEGVNNIQQSFTLDVVVRLK